MDKRILRNISYGLYVVTAAYEKDAGCIINTLSQVTSENPVISICLNKENYTNKVIKESKKFAVSIISLKTDSKVIGKFGFSSSLDTDKFEGIEYEDVDGIKVVKENTCGYMICEVLSIVDMETHDIFIARVVDAKKENDNEEMTYRYYHEVVKGKAPKKAPTYEEFEVVEKNENKNVYVCDLCGYKIELDDYLPEDFVCPLCGADRSQFLKSE